jgi:hypothetical protein
MAALFMDWLHIDWKEYDKLLDYDPRKLQYRGQRLLAFKMGKYYSIFQNKKQKTIQEGISWIFQLIRKSN